MQNYPPIKTEVELTLPLYELMHKTEQGWAGSLHFAVSDSVITVKDGKREIGQVVMCMRGGVEVRCKQIDEHQVWYLRPQDIWNVFCYAMGRPDLAEN